MDFTTAEELLAQGQAMFNDIGREGIHYVSIATIHLNLSQVSTANSVGLALLLEWQDQAQRSNKRLQIHQAPKSLMDIAHLSNCTNLLDFVA